jgi:hypothetical protein
MALHLTKVAFGAASIDHLAERLAMRAQDGPVFHHPLSAQAARGGGGTGLAVLDPEAPAGGALADPVVRRPRGRALRHPYRPALVLVQALPRRAHQGWRYLEAGCPARPERAATGIETMPPVLVGKLVELGLTQGSLMIFLPARGGGRPEGLTEGVPVGGWSTTAAGDTLHHAPHGPPPGRGGFVPSA